MSYSRLLGPSPLAGGGHCPAATSATAARNVVGSIMVVAPILIAMPFDRPIAAWVHGLAPVRQSMLPLMALARLPGHFGFTLVLAALLAWRMRRGLVAAAALLAGAAAASGVAAVLKVLVGRCRPFHGVGPFAFEPMPAFAGGLFQGTNLSFPSGDATLAFATAAAVLLCAPRWRALAFAWAGAVAVARVLQGAHYPSDVVAGAAVGLLIGGAVARRVLRLDRSAPPPQPHAPGTVTDGKAAPAAAAPRPQLIPHHVRYN